MKRLFVVLIAIFFVACAHHDVPPGKALLKSEALRELTERQAYAGDNEAARRMADYYYAKKDRANCIWWYKLAASRGDPVSKENLKRLEQETQ